MSGKSSKRPNSSATGRVAVHHGPPGGHRVGKGDLRRMSRSARAVEGDGGVAAGAGGRARFRFSAQCSRVSA